MNEFIVDEAGEVHATTIAYHKKTCRIVSSEPLLAIICSLLAEGEGQRLVCLLIPGVLNLMQVLEPLLSLRGGAGAQSLVVLQVPATKTGVSETGPPAIKLNLRIEAANIRALRRLQQGSCERTDEAGLQKGGPLGVEEIHEKALDVRSIQILICHHHYTTVAKRLEIGVHLLLLESQDLLDSSELLILAELVGTHIAHVQHLTLEGEDTPTLAPNDLEAGDCTGSSRISLCENKCALRRLVRAGQKSIDELRHSAQRGALLTIGLLRLLRSLGVQNALGLVEKSQLHQSVQVLRSALEDAAELRGRSRETLLRLGIKRRVHNGGVHEEHHCVLELRRLDLDLLLLERQLTEISENVASHCVDVLASLASIHTVHKAHMLLLGHRVLIVEESTRENRGNLPTLAALLIGQARIVLYEEANELLKGVGGNYRTIPRYLHITTSHCGNLNGASMKNLHHVVHGETDEAAEIGNIGDSDESLGLVLRDGGLAAVEHVILPCLAILEAVSRRTSLYSELVAEDVGELGTITVLATDNLLLLLVVIAAREKMAEDHLRNVNLLNRVLDNRNTVAVVLHRDTPLPCSLSRIRGRNADVDMLNRRSQGSAANEGIPRIHHNLIKQLVEARIELENLLHHLTLLYIIDPAALIMGLYRTNIGIRKLQDVLAVRVLLIGCGSRHFLLYELHMRPRSQIYGKGVPFKFDKYRAPLKSCPDINEL